MGELGQGLLLAAVGLGLTVAALAILVGLVLVIRRLFPARGVAPGAPPVPAPASTLERDTTEEEVAAAIAIALSWLRAYDIRRSGLGGALEAGHGAWWAGGDRWDRVWLPEPAPEE